MTRLAIFLYYNKVMIYRQIKMNERVRYSVSNYNL